MDRRIKKYSKDFGNKEFLLNYVNRRWGLTRTNKVGEVMALIRECQPRSFDEWESWYFENACTKTKKPIQVTKEILTELGERLYAKLQEIVIPQIKNAMRTLTLQDCLDYIYNLTIHRTYDGFLTEKSVVNDNLAKRFPEVSFEETDPRLDHAGDIDYIGSIIACLINNFVSWKLWSGDALVPAFDDRLFTAGRGRPATTNNYLIPTYLTRATLTV